jgi:hypothetical protein
MQISSLKKWLKSRPSSTKAWFGRQEFSRESAKRFCRQRIWEPAKKNPLNTISLLFIIAATICLFFLLLGGVVFKDIYLSRFDFEEPIRFVTKHNSVTFHLYGHCVDDLCTKPTMLNTFDEMPTKTEITNSSSKEKRDFPSIPAPSIPAPSIPAPSIPAPSIQNPTIPTPTISIPSPSLPSPTQIGKDINDTAHKVGDAVGDAAGKAGTAIGDTANGLKNSTEKFAKDMIDKAQKLLPELLSAFDGFKPKNPVGNFAGFFSIPYLIALIFNIVTLALLYFDFPTLATFTAVASLILTFLAWLFDMILFIWVFELIALIPGIGDQHNGPGIRLASAALICMAFGTGFLLVRVYFKCCCGPCIEAGKFRRKIGDDKKQHSNLENGLIKNGKIERIEMKEKEEKMDGFVNVDV